MGTVVSIVYKPKDAEPVQGGYTRVALQQASLTVGHGIEGDTKGSPGKRQINVMCAETVQQLATEGFIAEPGQLGEQLLVSGLDVDALAPGDHLRIGMTAEIEIVEPRTGCSKFERYQNRRPADAAGRLGMIARVAVSGSIAVGDEAVLVK